MTPVFTNLDAQFLYDLGETFIDDQDFETGMRLQQTASRLQTFDERASATDKDGQFAAGKLAAMREIYQRSNLPEGERTPTMQMRKVGIGKDVKVTKVPMGVTSIDPITRKAKAKPEPKLSPKLQALNGLKLNLEGLKL